MRSTYNNATVQSVTYAGEATTLSWELQHSLCAAAGRATPGSDLSGADNYHQQRPETYLNQYCAFSPDDNHVVAGSCNWRSQEFTHVSGTLGGGVGYMCAGSYSGGGSDCDHQVRVNGTVAAGHYPQATLNSGDAVFCSA